jgi:signal transduction histidine kinase
MSATASQAEMGRKTTVAAKNRTALEHLLHALNQPLTGLQCLLELAMLSPKRTDQYIQTLRESLDLTARARDLVAAIRELVDIQQSERRESEILFLDELLKEIVADLQPVAESRQVSLELEVNTHLPVRKERHRLKILIFRFLESALSLTNKGGDLQVSVRNEDRNAALMLLWGPCAVPEYSPFSRSELGLLIAQAGWEQLGGQWIQSRTGQRQSCDLRISLDCSQSQLESANSEALK